MKRKIKIFKRDLIDYIFLKKLIWGITFFDLFLFSTTIILGIIIYSVNFNEMSQNSDQIIATTLLLIDIPLGIFAAIALSKKWKYSWLLLALDAMLYGTAMILSDNWALGLVNLVIFPFIWAMSIYTWKNQEDNVEKSLIKTRQLNLWQSVLLLITIIVGSILVAYGISFIDKNEAEDYQIFFDSFAAVITLTATLAAVFRFREAWFLYLLANFVKIIMFSTLVANGEKENALSLLIACTYFVNSIYGIFLWKMKKDVVSTSFDNYYLNENKL